MMDETFHIPVLYKGEELSFEAKLLLLGSYTHKIQVEIYGHEVLFEPDEERNYRAVINVSQVEEGEKIPHDLLKAIADKIESIVK